MGFNRLPWVVFAAVSLASLACSKPGGEGTPASSQSAVVQSTAPLTNVSASASGRRRPDRGPRRAGIGMAGMLFHAARDIDLKEGQKATIEKLEQQLKGNDESTRTDFKEYHSTLVAGVKAGKLDTAKLTALKAKLETAAQARKDKQAESLNGLYAALEPEQRKAVAKAVREQQSKRPPHAGDRKDEDKKAAEGEWKKRRVEHLTQELGLDATQQKSVEALFSKGDHPGPAAMETTREEMKKRTEALLTAFEGEGFDAKKQELWPTPNKKMGEASDHHAQVLGQLIAILKPDQREKLAAKMERPGPRRVGYPVDDESGFGYFFDEPHQGSEEARALESPAASASASPPAPSASAPKP